MYIQVISIGCLIPDDLKGGVEFKLFLQPVINILNIRVIFISLVTTVENISVFK